MTSKLEENALFVRSQMENAARKVGRQVNEVRLIAVTKNIDVAIANDLIRIGNKELGENRVNELLRKKAEVVSKTVDWHFIGHLQSNKVRKIVGQCSLIHSVDSFELLGSLQQRAAELNLKQRILLQVNVSKEESKYGLDVEVVENVVAKASGCSNIQVEGLMTMAPLAGNPEASRPIFRSLRLLRDSLVSKGYTGIHHLSMGMSNDFAVAIEEGATLVRVGSRLFEGVAP